MAERARERYGAPRASASSRMESEVRIPFPPVPMCTLGRAIQRRVRGVEKRVRRARTSVLCVLSFQLRVLCVRSFLYSAREIALGGSEQHAIDERQVAAG